MTTHLSSTEERQPQPRLSLHQPHHNARILPDTEQSFRVAEIQRPQNLPEALPGRLRPHKLRTVMGTAVLDVSAHLDLATFEAVAPPPPPPHTSTETVHGSHPTTPTHKHRHNRNKIIFNRTTHGGATEANIDVLRNLCSPRPTRSTARRRMIAAMGVGDDDASVDVAPLCAPSVHPSSPRGALKAGGCIILTDAFMEAHRHHLRAYGRLRECLRWRRQRQTPNSPTTAAALAAAHKKPPTHHVHGDHVDEDHDGATQPRVEKITARVRRYVQQVREHQRPLLRRMESARVYGRGYYYTGAVPVADFSIVDESAVSEMDQRRISAAAA